MRLTVKEVASYAGMTTSTGGGSLPEMIIVPQKIHVAFGMETGGMTCAFLATWGVI
jgi:hypothetical protein